ncbi:uncharacterized protein PHACADRAFT_79943, partial [Phanerochaete carnosa HHB-10118-sp]
MPTTHPCGCVCPCDPTRTPVEVVHDAQKAVQNADQALRNIRNSGVSEEDIQLAQDRRHAAQLALDEAYKALIVQAKHPNPELDDDEAIATDDEGEDDESESEDISMDVGDVSALTELDEDDEDDEDFVPPEE